MAPPPYIPRVGIGRPGVGTEFAGLGNRIKGPNQRTVLGVVGLDPPASGPVAACKSLDHEAVVIQRRGGDRKAFLPTFGLHRPGQVTGLLIDGDELSVELPDKYLAVAQAEAATQPAATDAVDRLVQMRLVLPQNPAGFNAQCEHVVIAGDDIHDAFVDDGLGLPRITSAGAGSIQMRPPVGPKLRHVAAVRSG